MPDARRHVLTQFLWEAMVIVLAGGLLGLALGVFVTYTIGSLLFMGVMLGDELAKEHGRIDFEISAASVITSVGVLFLVGLIAGTLPAVRASRLDPVEPLHYE